MCFGSSPLSNRPHGIHKAKVTISITPAHAITTLHHCTCHCKYKVPFIRVCQGTLSQGLLVTGSSWVPLPRDSHIQSDAADDDCKQGTLLDIRPLAVGSRTICLVLNFLLDFLGGLSRGEAGSPVGASVNGVCKGGRTRQISK